MTLYSAAQARRAAKWRLPGIVFDYIDGAAGDEGAARHNRQALIDIALRNRVLTGVEAGPQAQTVLGQASALPFGISPMAMCALAHPQADAAMAAWSAQHQAPLGVSTSASSSLESMWRQSQGHAWFQLYHGGDIEQSMGLVQRAVDVGYQHLIFTADVPALGYRPRELAAGFRTPFKIGLKQFLSFASRPLWSIPTVLNGAPKLANFDSNAPFDRSRSRAGANLEFLAQLRDRWPGKLIVKGVSHPEDARQIKSLGADAVWVSNHGGRQLQSAAAAIDCLAPIREALGADISVFMDSGIQSGEDIVKAYALGADFVFIGRLALYALAAGGAQGLADISEMLDHTTRISLTQIGVSQLDALSAEHLN